MENCRELYKILDKEIKRLSQCDAITKSGAKKRKKIPVLISKRNSIKEEFDILAQEIIEEIKKFPPEKNFYADIIAIHYCKLTKSPKELQADIDLTGYIMKADNFRADLKKFWLKQF